MRINLAEVPIAVITPKDILIDDLSTRKTTRIPYTDASHQALHDELTAQLYASRDDIKYYHYPSSTSSIKDIRNRASHHKHLLEFRVDHHPYLVSAPNKYFYLKIIEALDASEDIPLLILTPGYRFIENKLPILTGVPEDADAVFLSLGKVLERHKMLNEFEGKYALPIEILAKKEDTSFYQVLGAAAPSAATLYLTAKAKAVARESYLCKFESDVITPTPITTTNLAKMCNLYTPETPLGVHSDLPFTEQQHHDQLFNEAEVRLRMINQVARSHPERARIVSRRAAL